MALLLFSFFDNYELDCCVQNKRIQFATLIHATPPRAPACGNDSSETNKKIVCTVTTRDTTLATSMRFDRASNVHATFRAPNPAGNPHQNYSRISTVGTPTFLGPGRVFAAGNLDPPRAGGSQGVLASGSGVFPTYHTPYLSHCNTCRWSSAVALHSTRRKGGRLEPGAVSTNCRFRFLSH